MWTLQYDIVEFLFTVDVIISEKKWQVGYNLMKQYNIVK